MAKKTKSYFNPSLAANAEPTFRSLSLGGASTSPPIIIGVPTISGVAVVGNTLTATPAAVTGTPIPTTSWQWRRNGTPIPGATNISYTLVQSDAGNTSNIDVVQTATNSVGSSSATSAAIAVVYDAMAWDYRQRVIAAGGTMDLARLQLLQGTVIIPCKTILEQLNFGAGVNKGALHIYTAENATQALTNILNPNFTATTINTPTFTANSFYTGGTGTAINSNWNASTLALGTNQIIVAAIWNNIPSTNFHLIGMQSSTTQNSCYTYVDAASFAGRMLTVNERSASVTNARIGWHSMRRLGTSIIWNSNAAQRSFTDAATGIFANLNFYDLALNVNGNVNSGSNRQQCAAIKGAYINDTDLNTLRLAIIDYCRTINPALVINT